METANQGIIRLAITIVAEIRMAYCNEGLIEWRKKIMARIETTGADVYCTITNCEGQRGY